MAPEPLALKAARAPAADRSVWGVHDSQGFGSPKPSGCGFYRVIWPIEQLAKHGWAAAYGIGMPPVDVNVVVGERFDQASVIPYWEAMKGIYGLVYEIDDDPFSVDEVNWLAYPMYSKHEVLHTIRTCAQMADLVTVSTEPLAQVMRQFNPEVRVTPTSTPARVRATARPHHSKLTIGWTGGVSHMRDMAMIAQVWRDVIDATGARGHFVGADYRNMVRPEGFDYTPWVEDVPSYFRLLDFDIGLAPLAPHPFADSKSHIKALEYAALGIPCIASDCLAYRDFVIDGVTGFLVRTPGEWREAMMLLAHDERMRSEMGVKARELASTWTVEANWQRWDSVYQRLL